MGDGHKVLGFYTYVCWLPGILVIFRSDNVVVVSLFGFSVKVMIVSLDFCVRFSLCVSGI